MLLNNLNNLTRFEKSALVIALWFCIGEIIHLLFLIIDADKLGMMFWAVTTLRLQPDVIDILNSTYTGWKILYAGWLMYAWGLVICLILINRDKQCCS